MNWVLSVCSLKWNLKHLILLVEFLILKPFFAIFYLSMANVILFSNVYMFEDCFDCSQSFTKWPAPFLLLMQQKLDECKLIIFYRCSFINLNYSLQPLVKESCTILGVDLAVHSSFKIFTSKTVNNERATVGLIKRELKNSKTRSW